MRARKDLVLDLIYGILLSIILLVHPTSNYIKYDVFTIELFKSLCVVGIIFIWLSSITKGFKVSPFVEVISKNRFDVNQLLVNIRDLTSPKIAVIAFVFSVKFIFKGEYFFEEIVLRSLQVSISVIYLMTLYMILNNLKQVKNIRLWLLAVITAPFFVITYLNEEFNLGVVSALIFPNNLMVLSNTFTILNMCIYLVGLLATLYVFFILLKAEFALLKSIAGKN